MMRYGRLEAVLVRERTQLWLLGGGGAGLLATLTLLGMALLS